MMQQNKNFNSSSNQLIVGIQAVFALFAAITSSWLATWLDTYVFVGILIGLLFFLVPMAIIGQMKQWLKTEELEGAIWGFIAGIITSLIANLSHSAVSHISIILILFIGVFCLTISQKLPKVNQLLSKYFWYRLFFGQGFIRDILGGLLGILLSMILIFLSLYLANGSTGFFCGIGILILISVGGIAAFVSARAWGAYFAAFLSGLGSCFLVMQFLDLFRNFDPTWHLVTWIIIYLFIFFPLTLVGAIIMVKIMKILAIKERDHLDRMERDRLALPIESRISEDVNTGKLLITLVSVRTLPVPPNRKQNIRAGHMMIVVRVKLINITDSVLHSYQIKNFRIKTGNGVIDEEDRSYGRHLIYSDNDELPIVYSLASNGFIEGDMVFQVPIGDHNITLEFDYSLSHEYRDQSVETINRMISWKLNI